MTQELITRAEKIIMSKTGYIGGGMEGYCTLALIDEEGYPSTSTISISKADGLKWITFLSGFLSQIKQSELPNATAVAFVLTLLRTT
jgi:hypothetical protein